MKHTSYYAEAQRTNLRNEYNTFMGTGDPWHNLANAIVIQAVSDYRKALRDLEEDPKSKFRQSRVNDLERFFKGQWCSELTDISGETIIKRIKEERR